MVDDLFEALEDLFERRKKKGKDKGRDREDSGEPRATAPAPAVFCLDCGARNDGASKFCQQCGELLPSAGDEMRCLKCNAEVPLTAKFCGRCGARVA